MNQPPRPITDRPRPDTFLAGPELGRSIAQGLGIAAAVLGMYYITMQQGQSMAQVRTQVFATLVLSNILLTLVNRSLTQSVFQTLRIPNPVVTFTLGLTFGLLITTLFVPDVRQLFGFAPVSAAALGWCALAALLGVD